MSNLAAYAPPLGYRLLDRTVYDSSATWTKPTDYAGNVAGGAGQMVRVIVVGGGVGGRGGYRGAANPIPSMGGFVRRGWFPFSVVPSSVSVTVGAGSAGTTGTATTSQATNPSDGGFSAFGALLRADGGKATGGSTVLFGSSILSNITGSAIAAILPYLEAAGFGGGITNSTLYEPTAGLGPEGGGIPGANGTNHATTPTAGTAGTDNPVGPGAGGGKGGDSLANTVSAAAGGAGGTPGGAGGHGGNQPGAASAGSAGNGGAGANGRVIVEVWGF